MYAREKEIVTDEFLLREDTYNLRRGGTGGFDYINNNETMRIEKNKKARESTDRVIFEKYGVPNINQTEQWQVDHSELMKSRWKDGKYEHLKDREGTFKGRTHSSESKNKISRANSGLTGDKNSQFGTMWITDGIINKKIKKEELIPPFWNKGRTVTK
jgi:hypothetical protein